MQILYASSILNKFAKNINAKMKQGHLMMPLFFIAPRLKNLQYFFAFFSEQFLAQPKILSFP